MPEIKTRETVKDIKVLDKSKVAAEKMKKAFIRSKDAAENLMDDGQVSPSEYAEDKVKYAAEDVAQDTGNAVKKQADKAVEKGREKHRERRQEKRLQKQNEKVEQAVKRYEQKTEEKKKPSAHQTETGIPKDAKEPHTQQPVTARAEQPRASHPLCGVHR